MSWPRAASGPASASPPPTGGGDVSVRSIPRKAAASASLPSSSTTASAWACSGVAPRASASATTSSRCCVSSCTISASRAGASLRGLSRRAISCCRSGMTKPRDTVDGADEGDPALALGVEHAGACGGEPVVAAPPLAGFPRPVAGDPRATLQPVEQGVKGGDMQAHHPARSVFDELAQLVAMARLVLEEGEDEKLRAALLQLAVVQVVLHIWLRQI